jgi:hypothetical protein
VWAVAALSLLAGVLALPQTAHARKTVTEFNYQFDSGGQLHEFIHNDPSAGADVQWQAGGALGSIGCLRVTGENATADTRYEWFKGGESTISFHYFIHGYNRFRVRLNAARPEDVTKFGRYGNYPIAKVEQDKWVFVQFKVTDVHGDAAAKPAADAETIFKTISFIADERAGGADSYMLLDNIRLGPQIDEKDIKVAARGVKTFGKEARTLMDFEKDADLRLMRCPDEDDVVVTASDKWASSGKKSAMLTCKPGKAWTALEFDKSLIADWSKYDYLTFDLYTEDPNFIRMNAELWDTATKGFPTRATYGEGIAVQMKVGPIHKGLNHVRIGLRFARRNGKEGLDFSELRKEDRIDLGALTKFKFWFSTEQIKKPYIVYMDNVRLCQEGALDTNMKITVPAGALAFDFGEGSPLVEGFTEASVVDVWGEGKPFGFVHPQGLHAAGRDWPDPLTGDYIAPAAGKAGELEFRVRVPNGKYLVWVCGGFFPEPNVYTDLNVNGRMLFTGEMNADRFYSTKWFFRFLETQYSEKPNALWSDYVEKMYPGTVVETEVADGELYVKGANSFLSALVVMPAARKAEFDALVKQIHDERIRYFYRDLYLERPVNEPCRTSDPDFVLFAPADNKGIMPWSGFGPADAAEVRRVAAGGEALCVEVAVRPFRDAEDLKLVVSDLAGPGQARIAGKDVKLFLKQYLSNGLAVRPWVLYPTDHMPMEKNLTRAFWLRFRVPKDAAAGVYKGELTATATARPGSPQAGGAVRKLPIEVQVYPVALAAEVPLAVGYYYGSPDEGQSAAFDRVENFQTQRDQILREQMELLHDYGMTSITIPCPRVTGLKGSGVSLDFAGTDKVAKAARAAGLAATDKQPLLTSTLGIGRSIGPQLAGSKQLEIGEELKLKGFAPAFVSGTMQLVEWAQRTKTPLVQWVVDEPRETPNPWNRNLADTIAYLDLAGQAPGVVRMITPMGDTNGRKDYLPMLDHMEIVATHATVSSQRMIERAMKTGKPVLWIYNVGCDRLSNGLYLWRVGAQGKHEWHFNQGVADGDTYPGRETHNPFVNFEFTQVTAPAPLSMPGALLPMEGLVTMSGGVSDYRYLCTLEQALAAAKADTAKAAAVKKAEEYLASLRTQVPVLPKVRGLTDLAAVGTGIEGDGKLNLEEVKRKLAELIVELQAGK